MIRWRTYSYRALALWCMGLLTVVAGVLLLLFPEWRVALVDTLSRSAGESSEAADEAARQARFTNLDGGVRVRKATELQWQPATFSMGLDEGDLVQTTHDGVARVAFADGTLYVVKPDTLIVIKENTSPTEQSAANVAVQVSSGVVDLSTSRSTEGRVLFADAEARIHRESRALVRNDPQTNTHQITVSKGAANLRRGGERVELAQYEQATFHGEGSEVVKEKIVAPPILLTPANMAPVVISGEQRTEVEFTWAAMPGMDSYRLRVSRSPIFSGLLYDRRLQSTSVRLPSFGEGDYYWSVTSIDRESQESQQSEPNQFSVIRQDNGGEILLLVERYIQHGKVIELIGRTEPGATVLVNNQPVFSVAPNGSFKHFTAPLPNVGPNRVTITAQNSEGKVATLRKTVTIQ